MSKKFTFSILTFATIRGAIRNIKSSGASLKKLKLSPLDYKRFGKLCEESSAGQTDVPYAELYGVRIVADDRVPNGEIWIV